MTITVRYYDVPVVLCQCDHRHCGYNFNVKQQMPWMELRGRLPERCPKCKRKGWNKHRRGSNSVRTVSGGQFESNRGRH